MSEIKAPRVSCKIQKVGQERWVEVFADNLPDMLQRIAIAWRELDPEIEQLRHDAMMYYIKAVHEGKVEPRRFQDLEKSP